MKVSSRQQPEKLFKGPSRFFRKLSEFDPSLTLHIGDPDNFPFSIEDKIISIYKESNLLLFFKGRRWDSIFHPDPAQGNISGPSPDEMWSIKRVYDYSSFQVLSWILTPFN
jgi:hypothetical protein